MDVFKSKNKTEKLVYKPRESGYVCNIDVTTAEQKEKLIKELGEKNPEITGETLIIFHRYSTDEEEGKLREITSTELYLLNQFNSLVLQIAQLKK